MTRLGMRRRMGDAVLLTTPANLASWMEAPVELVATLQHPLASGVELAVAQAAGQA